MLQRHPQSSPDCPTRPLGLPGRSGTGSGTAKSHAHDRRSSSVSCRSAASAQSGTGASHIADEADKVNCNNKHFIEDLPSLQLYLHTSNILFSASRQFFSLSSIDPSIHLLTSYREIPQTIGLQAFYIVLFNRKRKTLKGYINWDTMLITCCCERPSGAGHSTGSTLKQSTSMKSSDSSSSKQADFLSKRLKREQKRTVKHNTIMLKGYNCCAGPLLTLSH